MKYLEAKALRNAPENKALSGPPESKDDSEDTGPLAGVPFASPAARAAAEEAELAADAFKKAQPSGARGFTADDVREIAASVSKPADGE